MISGLLILKLNLITRTFPQLIDFLLFDFLKIISHLINQVKEKTIPLKVLEEYVEYTTWISDYLEIYSLPGVFLLDECHRFRVASEKRNWNERSQASSWSLFFFCARHQPPRAATNDLSRSDRVSGNAHPSRNMKNTAPPMHRAAHR